MYHSFMKMDQDHVPYIYLVGMLCSNACMKQIYDIDDLRKCLMQTLFDFEQ